MTAPIASHTKQILGLDLLRFMAAFAVMAFHFLYLSSMEGHSQYNLTHGTISFAEGHQLPKLGWIGVEVFFLISGFVISLSATGRTATTFFQSRFLRLVPCAWICATLSLIAALLIAEGSLYSISKRYILSILFVPIGQYIDAPYWTLGVEIMFYGTIWSLLYFRKWDYFYHLMVGLTAVSFAFNFIKFSVPELWAFNHRVADLLLLKHGCEFALGGMIYLAFIEKTKRHLLLPASLALVASCYEIALQYSVHSHLNWNDREFITLMVIWFCSITSFLLFLLFNERLYNYISDRSRKVVREIGMMTYPLYLLHSLIGSALLYQLVQMGLDKYTALFYVVIFILTLTFLVSRFEPYVRNHLKGVLASVLNKVTLFRIKFKRPI